MIFLLLLVGCTSAIATKLTDSSDGIFHQLNIDPTTPDFTQSNQTFLDLHACNISNFSMAEAQAQVQAIPPWNRSCVMFNMSNIVIYVFSNNETNHTCDFDMDGVNMTTRYVAVCSSSPPLLPSPSPSPTHSSGPPIDALAIPFIIFGVFFGAVLLNVGLVMLCDKYRTTCGKC
jgi:hypothetical protein